MATRSADAPGEAHALRPLRPETVVLALLGDQILGRRPAVAIGSLITVLGRLGIGEHATRATLKRMTQRGLLDTTRQGRQVYLGPTPHAENILLDGRRRLEAEVVNRDWDGRWTLLAFSIPESRRSDRHVLRTRLTWAGFGLLRNGLWISASDTDVSPALDELDLLSHTKVFRAEAAQWTDPADLVREAWDLDALAAGYTRFLDRWTHGEFDDLDELSRETLVHGEWLLLLREDPRLPVDLLPADWPGVEAEQLFWTLRDKLAGPAAKLASEVLETLPVTADR
jgi:phenylacetic acid degradation operon negative regulatory protein